MPTDTDTHQAEYIALRLAERIDAVVTLETAFCRCTDNMRSVFQPKLLARASELQNQMI